MLEGALEKAPLKRFWIVLDRLRGKHRIDGTTMADIPAR
ncbi:hypothetical protein HM1_1716 [Heliomicrobium modesticaldum Ice1]|uniref:Uncharacterized protein n=1 Tax=Heliobacterium modesticaldum (strain ATCC 51547 / Ice1) TaxID=498761 RepID=B0TE91_HELMI|nr:hypothetical protein HM1_1716 [Heliomicrobium modesticaldum Ice1]